ncbi:hypothetical protein D3C85_897060 [compost metagenome]
MGSLYPRQTKIHWAHAPCHILRLKLSAGLLVGRDSCQRDWGHEYGVAQSVLLPVGDLSSGQRPVIDGHITGLTVAGAHSAVAEVTANCDRCACGLHEHIQGHGHGRFFNPVDKYLGGRPRFVELHHVMVAAYG